MKKINQTPNIEINRRTPDRTKEYTIGSTIYIVNSFFSDSSKTTARDIIKRLAVREIDKITA